MQARNRKEIEEQIDEIKKLVENEVHPALSPDRWYVYSNLHDEIDQLVIILKNYGVLCD